MSDPQLLIPGSDVAATGVPGPVTDSPGLSHFFGSKGGSGIPQWLISQMPPHECYVEAFMGTGIVLRTKLPAREQFGIDLDPAAIESANAWKYDFPRFNTICGDALEELPRLRLDRSCLVYADPPYPASVRASGNRKRYKFEGLTDEWHERLLTLLLSLDCNVILSGYHSELYCRRLKDWRTSYKWTVNRAGTRVKEFVWMNFGEPALLHDSRFVGGNFTDRQRVKRKIERWKSKFLTMSPAERWAIYEALSSVVDVNQPTLKYEH